MSVQRTAAAACALAALSALGTGCDRGETGGVRVPDEDARRQAGMLALADRQVLDAMQAPRVPGRIIYDPPTDLSLANARRTRPDLVRPDTTRRDTTSVRRDTTAGDAAADTSGGAARPRRP